MCLCGGPDLEVQKDGSQFSAFCPQKARIVLEMLFPGKARWKINILLPASQKVSAVTSFISSSSISLSPSVPRAYSLAGGGGYRAVKRYHVII